ncbi:PAS domain-containing protein [Dongia deserti]|uniref:PAS domain-containing protein n=1 Tax=Dongia deserti TaxID=2268030 RepID=UPI0013C47A3F|nr:PAS domain-containing protein [Dongia deserti]
MSTATPPGSGTDTASVQAVYRFDIPLSEVASAPIRGFDAYWRGKMKDGRLPSREDIDPAEIVPLLPDLVLLNVEWEPFRCRVRLRGTRAEQFRPVDTTKYIDSSTIFDPGRREDYIAEMKFVATGHRPAFARDWMTTRFGAVREIFAGIWPLAADGSHVDMLVVIEDFAGLSIEDFAF